jgi:hypothetical protein
MTVIGGRRPFVRDGWLGLARVGDGMQLHTAATDSGSMTKRLGPNSALLTSQLQTDKWFSFLALGELGPPHHFFNTTNQLQSTQKLKICIIPSYGNWTVI